MHTWSLSCWGRCAASDSLHLQVTHGNPKQAVQRFRERVDAELPGMYAWFADCSLHVTLRAIMG